MTIRKTKKTSSAVSRSHKVGLNEDFLSDDKPTEEPVDSLTRASTEKEDLEDLLGDGDEEKKEQDSGMENKAGDSVGELKDIISNLNTTVQTLADTIAKQAEEQKKDKEEESEPQEDEFDGLDFGDEEEESEEGEPEETESGDGESNEGEEGSSEEGDSSEDKEEGDSEEKTGDKEEASDEEFAGDDESDEKKSEAYNRNMKRGKLLNSSSGSLIGPLVTGKMWKLDESILTLVKLKIRQRIEEAKRAFRTKVLRDGEGEL